MIELMALRRRESVITRLIDALEKMSPGDAADSIGAVLATSFKADSLSA